MLKEPENIERPLVTIGIINYNGIRYLEKCVDSFLNQTYDNVEIIIIDDFSTDGCVEKLKAIEQKNHKIKCIFHKKNSGGPSQGIKEIIKGAKGKYFQWIASDDYVDAKAVEKFVDYLEKTGNDYVYCNFNIINEENKVINHWNYSVPLLDDMVYRIFTYCSGIIPMNGLYRLEFFHKNNLTWSTYRNNDHSSDTLNSLYFIKNGLKYGMVDESLIFYRIHDKNCSHNIEDRIKSSLSIYMYIIENFNEEIYLPYVKWDDSRAVQKNYEIALFLYKKIISYSSFNGLPAYIKNNISRDKMIECLSEYVKEGLKYVEEGLAKEDASTGLKQLEAKYLECLN